MLANDSQTQPFKGYLDNIRVLVGAGSEGALSAVAIDFIRAGDLNPPAAAPVAPVMTALPLTGDTWKFRWLSQADTAYTLQYSTDLAAWFDQVLLPGTGGLLLHTVPALEADKRFYRLGVAR